ARAGGGARAAARAGGGSRAALWAQVLRLGPAGARTRVRAAGELRAGLSPTGEPVPARRPVLAAGVAAGDVGPAQLGLALRTLDRVDRTPGVEHEAVERDEQVLDVHEPLYGPMEYRNVTIRESEHLDPTCRSHTERY